MKAAVIKNNKVLIQEIPLPVPQENEVLIKTTVLGKNSIKLCLLEALGIETKTLSDEINHKFHVVIEASGSPDGFIKAMALTLPRGMIVLKSTVSEYVSLNLAPIVINEINVMGSRCGLFPGAIEALKQRKINVSNLISARYSINKIQEAFDFAQKPEVLKVIVDFAL